MATYPIKMLKDENGQAFVPLTSLDAVIGEKNLQYILDAAQVSPGHFRVNYKDLKMTDLVNSIIVIRWPEITSTVKPSYLQLNTETEVILYNGTGTEYLDLEEASGTVNMLAYDGTKWILTSGAGSGSGHVITDDEGHTMEQQKILNFVGFNVENDTANRATKIINPTPINNLTTTESGQGSLDAYQGNILSKRSVPVGGTKGQVLAKSGNGDHQLEWINQDSDDVVTSDGSIEEIIGLTYEEYKALEAAGQLKPTTQYHITDMGDIVVGLTEASMVEFSNGTNLEDRMNAKDIVDDGQNDRLDIAESNIDAMAGVVNSHSETLASLHAQDVSAAVVPYDTSVVGLGGHSSLIKYGPVYAYQVSFSTGTALAANTSYLLATISSAHRPNISNKSIQGVIRANNDTFVSFWISEGQVQIYPTTTIPSGANLAGSFSWINL
jgi:hypothetical protein